HCLIAENGVIFTESNRFQFDSQSICADLDLARLDHERFCNSSFSAARTTRDFLRIPVCLHQPATVFRSELLRPNPAMPFVPSDPQTRADTCREIFSIQSAGLAKRLRHTGAKSVVIGISGGLDSTLALLV